METEHDFVWHMNNPRNTTFKYADHLTQSAHAVILFITTGFGFLVIKVGRCVLKLS